MMLKKISLLVLSSGLLTACHWMDFSSNGGSGDQYGDNYYHQTNTPVAENTNGSPQRVGNIPQMTESSSFAYKRNPDKHESLDSQWVNSQSPNSYTIELAHSEKPAEVAKQLTDTPKLERTAQIKYQNNGKTYYRGVYGTYSSREAAEAALKKLPENIRQQADIHQWSSVQSTTKTEL